MGTKKPDWEGRPDHGAQLQGAAALQRGDEGSDLGPLRAALTFIHLSSEL